MLVAVRRVVAQVGGVTIGGRSAPDANEAPDPLLVHTAAVAAIVTIRAICLAAKEHAEIVLAYTCTLVEEGDRSTNLSTYVTSGSLKMGMRRRECDRSQVTEMSQQSTRW